jgi:hypothetical protein
MRPAGGHRSDALVTRSVAWLPALGQWTVEPDRVAIAWAGAHGLSPAALRSTPGSVRPRHKEARRANAAQNSDRREPPISLLHVGLRETAGSWGDRYSRAPAARAGLLIEERDSNRQPTVRNRCDAPVRPDAGGQSVKLEHHVIAELPRARPGSPAAA